jgi:hypothetical protein
VRMSTRGRAIFAEDFRGLTQTVHENDGTLRKVTPRQESSALIQTLSRLKTSMMKALFLRFLTLGHGTDRLPRNVGTELPLNAA